MSYNETKSGNAGEKNIFFLALSLDFIYFCRQSMNNRVNDEAVNLYQG